MRFETGNGRPFASLAGNISQKLKSTFYKIILYFWLFPRQNEAWRDESNNWIFRCLSNQTYLWFSTSNDDRTGQNPRSSMQNAGADVGNRSSIGPNELSLSLSLKKLVTLINSPPKNYLINIRVKSLYPYEVLKNRQISLTLSKTVNNINYKKAVDKCRIYHLTKLPLNDYLMIIL